MCLIMFEYLLVRLSVLKYDFVTMCECAWKYVRVFKSVCECVSVLKVLCEYVWVFVSVCVWFCGWKCVCELACFRIWKSVSVRVHECKIVNSLRLSVCECLRVLVCPCECEYLLVCECGWVYEIVCERKCLSVSVW